MSSSKLLRQYYYFINSFLPFKRSPPSDESTSDHLKLPFIADDTQEPHETTTSSNANNTKKSINWPLFLLSCTFVAVGIIGGPLISRLYYMHGGNRRWITSTMETAGFPILFIPLYTLYLKSKSHGVPFSSFVIEPKLFIISALIGLLLGLENYLYSLGISYTPVSTSSILFATQLAFLSVFSFFLVKQKFTVFSINSVFLMTTGSVLLGLRTKGDKPDGVSKGNYLWGFSLVVASAALLGLIWPLVELAYSKARQTVNYSIVLQFQINLSIFATIFSATGMFVNNDFSVITKEADEYGLGSGLYYTVLFSGAVVWQLSFIGGVGVVFCANSLLNGILSAVLLPMTEVAAVIAFKEDFNGEKALALVLCLWGFGSYFYGEYKMSKKLKKSPKILVDEVPTRVHSSV